MENISALGTLGSSGTILDVVTRVASSSADTAAVATSLGTTVVAGTIKTTAMYHRVETENMAYILEYDYNTAVKHPWPGQHSRDRAPNVTVNGKTKIALEGRYAHILDDDGRDVKLFVFEKIAKTIGPSATAVEVPTAVLALRQVKTSRLPLLASLPHSRREAGERTRSGRAAARSRRSSGRSASSSARSASSSSVTRSGRCDPLLLRTWPDLLVTSIWELLGANPPSGVRFQISPCVLLVVPLLPLQPIGREAKHVDFIQNRIRMVQLLRTRANDWHSVTPVTQSPS